MRKKVLHRLSVFFLILFMAVISAPSVIMTIDDSIDVTFFYGENEEEEKENIKLILEYTSQDFDDCYKDIVDVNNIGYTFKSYKRPHLNLISPPPEFIS